MNKTLTRLWTGQEGQGLIEYVSIIGWVSVAAIASLIVLKDHILALFNLINI